MIAYPFVRAKLAISKSNDVLSIKIRPAVPMFLSFVHSLFTVCWLIGEVVLILILIGVDIKLSTGALPLDRGGVLLGVLAVWICFGVWNAWSLAWLYSGYEIIHVEQGTVRTVRKTLGYGRERVFQLSQLEAVTSSPESLWDRTIWTVGTEVGFVGGSIVVRCEGRDHRVGYALSRSQADSVVAALNEQIRIPEEVEGHTRRESQ